MRAVSNAVGSLILRKRYALLRELAAQTYTIPYSDSSRISIRSLERYLQAYERGQFDALKPKAREKRGSLHDLDPQILSMALALRHELPSRSVETIIRMLEIDTSNPLLPGILKPRTLARYFQEQGVSKRDLARQANATKVFKHFEHDESNDCWQADTQHTTAISDPADPDKRRKVYLIAIIDDHSRRIMHAEFQPIQQFACPTI